MTIADQTFTSPFDQNPEDANGQWLGAVGARWNLYTEEVIFGGTGTSNRLVFPDNDEAALLVEDAGGIEYGRFDTRNAQPVVHWNEDEANIDFRWDSNAGTFAFIIQGSDGFVGLNIAVPLAEFHVVGRAIIGDAGPINGSDYDLALNEYMTFWAVDANESYMSHNLYFNAGWKHRENGFATLFNFGDGVDIRAYATDVQDAAATQVGRMHLNSSGNLVIYTGDTYWVGDGSGLLFGSLWGNETGWTQAAAVQNTWYEIIDADITTGQLNDVTHDGNGELTVGKAGRYGITWSLSVDDSANNDHVQATIYANGAATNDGMNHVETSKANDHLAMAGTAILDLAATSTIALCIRTTDNNTPTLGVDHVNIKVEQMGGT